MTTLVFSIGPVQSFIAQSRRTADGWVGSYLISYLAGHAIAAIESKVRVIEPDLKNVAVYEAIKAQLNGSLRKGVIAGDTTIAALPNTIVADTKGNDPNSLGKEAAGAAKKGWEQLERAVWHSLPNVMTQNDNVAAIWKRQVSNPWEFYWAWGEKPKEAFDNLAARKGLRDFEQVAEEGDRCTVCGQREALWDKNEPRRDKEKQNRDVARRLWREEWQGAIVNVLRSAPEHLFQPEGKERVCAICIIKRLVPWTKNPIGEIWHSGKGSLSEPTVFPSTSTMATVLYRAELLKKKEAVKSIAKYYEVLGKVSKDFIKLSDPIDAFSCWQEALTIAKANGIDNAEEIIRIDGDWFLYGEAVKNEYKDEIKENQHRDITRAYADMCEAGEKTGVGSPPIYWALLTMDGDKMGDFLRKVDGAGIDTGDVSSILNKFAQSVPEVVRAHQGRSIFAGGDDVLAFLPFDTALDAADELRRLFLCKFAEWLEGKRQPKPTPEILALPNPTLSGAIVYAHHLASLAAVLRSGHTLLTEWSKKRAKRNALTIQQYQRGGPNLSFAAKWTSENCPSLKDRIQRVVRQIKERELSPGIFYHLRESAWMFNKDGPFGDLRDHKNNQKGLKDATAWIAAYLGKSRLRENTESESEKQGRTTSLAGELLMICLDSAGESTEHRFSADALLMCRFIAGGGKEQR